MSDSLAALLRLLAVVAAIAAVWIFGRETVQAIRAPVQAELNASRGNNQAIVKAAVAQNQGVDSLKAAGEVRQAKSAAAVDAAGKPQQQRVKEILEAPAVGKTDYERAMNRIDRELGLR